MRRFIGEDYLRWSAEWQSPLRGQRLFNHAREPANFVASRGKTTGLSEPGYNGGRVEGVPTGLSEPGYNGGRVEGVPTGLSEPGDVSSLTPRGQKKAARVAPRGFCEG